MEIVTVCGLTYSDFVINRMPEVKRAGLLVFSFGAVETVDFRKEIKRDDGVFVDLCTLSYDLDCAVLCGADTDVYGIRHKSVILADKGRLVDVSDMVNASTGYSPGTSYRTYRTSAGKIGVVVDCDIMSLESVKAVRADGADIIVNVADKDVCSKQILAARAAGLFNALPVLSVSRNYALLSDGEGEVKFAGRADVNVWEFAP